MRASPSRLLPLALLVACVTRGDDTSARAADSTRPPAASLPAVPDSAAARAGAQAATTTTTAPDAGGSLVGATRAAGDTLCVGIAAAAGRALQIAFVSDTGSAFPSPRGRGPLWRGCRVHGTGTVRRYGAASAMPEPKLRAAMRGTGWVEDASFEASGPESSAFALRRGEALCHYDVLFPGSPGDDDDGARPDTSAAPLPYVVHILCTPSAPPPRGS